MQVTITGLVGDSSAAYASGRIEFAQAQRLDTGELLVTSTIATAQVVNGELRTLAGRPFELPSNPEGSAVRVREILGGSTYEWWTAVPEQDSVEYRELLPVESSSVPESVWGPPPWLSTVQRLHDETIESVENAQELVDTLGGLAGIQGLVDDAEAASTAAAGSATQAHAEADRAQQAADSIDMTALNERMDDMDTALGEKADADEVATALAEKASVEYVDTAIENSKPNPNVESASLYSYGHSYTKVPSEYVTTNSAEYPLVVHRRLNFGHVFPRGRGGTPLLDTFPCALAPAWGDTHQGVTIDRTWEPGSRGVVMLQNYLNEINSGGAWLTQANVDFWGVMLRSMFALLSSASIIPASAGTETGSWADVTSVISQACYGGVLRRSAAVANSSKSFTVTGDEVYLLTVAGTSGAAGNLVAKCNGVTVQQIVMNGARPAYTSVVDNTLTTLTPVAIRISGLNAAAGTTGNKTLRIEWPGPSGAHGFIHGVIVPSSAPPQIFYGLEPPRNTTNFVTANPLYRAKVAEIAAEFPNVTIVDLLPGYSIEEMTSSLDSANPKFHPNDLGQRHIATKFENAIRERITGPMPGVITL